MSRINLKSALRLSPTPVQKAWPKKWPSAAKSPQPADRLAAHVETIVRKGLKDIIDRSVKREVDVQMRELRLRLEKIERSSANGYPPLRKSEAPEPLSVRPITRNNGEINEAATLIKALHKRGKR